MSVIGVNYNEGSKKKDLGYKSVDISYDNLKKEKVFKSGNFVKDWYDLRKFIITKLRDKEYPCMCSSSVDHFFMDGAKYDRAYLTSKDNGKTWQLEYDVRSEEGIKFYVKKGTKPTWEELRKLCGDKPKKKKRNEKA